MPARPACHLPDGARRRTRRRRVARRRGGTRRRGGRLREQRALQVWRRTKHHRPSGPRTIERRRRRHGQGPRGAAREVVQHGRIGLAIGEPPHEVLYTQLLACLRDDRARQRARRHRARRRARQAGIARERGRGGAPVPVGRQLVLLAVGAARARQPFLAMRAGQPPSVGRRRRSTGLGGENGQVRAGSWRRRHGSGSARGHAPRGHAEARGHAPRKARGQVHADLCRVAVDLLEDVDLCW